MKIVLPDADDWGDISDLIAKSIPNAIVSHLGNRFGKNFYKILSEHRCSCVYVCKDFQDDLKGVIIGTTDHSASYSGIRKNRFKLLLAMNFRLFKWVVLKWIARKVFTKISSQKAKCDFYVKAELIVVAVSEDMRGKGFATKLIQKMESFLGTQDEGDIYFILTEKSNERANKFYRKIGAELVTTCAGGARNINRWHKTLR